MPERVHVGPTLWWLLREPEIGKRFEDHGVEHEVVEVEPYDGGFLVTTRIVRAPR